GYMLESALESGLSAAGVDVLLLGPMPTPGIAYLTKSSRAQAGIVISASHNPYNDNGFKFFSGKGFKLEDKIELEIERELEKPLEVMEPTRLGKARRMDDAAGRYIEFCKSKIDYGVNLNGIKLVVDCAHGAAYDIAPQVFEELGADVLAIGSAPDGKNINDGVGATHTEKLQKSVLSAQADIGIALDGDGDRLILVDADGEIVDGDEIIYIIAKSCSDTLNGAVVGTLMSNLGLEKSILEMNLGFHRANVGDRYVMDILRSKQLTLGGESSGHIINLSKTTTGDGVISALSVLETIVKSNKSLVELKTGMSKCPQVLINVKSVPNLNIFDLPEITGLVKDVEEQLGNEGRVLLRPSGTEPLVRVMVEGMNENTVSILAKQLASEVEETLQSR
ncbi:MAG: phosphoglucosamine mutase, partial [Gammaproteobacteria bacterium]|nr:phosphoglucosamine mutase [Gammaproteobacteria bacterium]